MPLSPRRVVLTGIGVLSPIGLTPDGFWAALRAGRSGVRPIRSFDAGGLACRIAGEVEGFDAKNYIDKKERKNLKLMARTIQLAVSAAQLAWDDSKLDRARVDPTRFGVEFGAGLIASELDELAPAAKASANCQPGVVDLDKWGSEGLHQMPPLWMLKYLPNMLPARCRSCRTPRGPTTPSPRPTWPACWPSARRRGSSPAARPTCSWPAAGTAR